MNWKESKLVGAAAFLLIVVAVVAIVFFVNSQTGTGPYEYFLCESTGKIFTVAMLPSNEDYVQNYLNVTQGAAAPCKICDKTDAFRAQRASDDKWIKQSFAYFKCDSTGEIFNVTTARGEEGYDGQLLQNPGEAVKCLVCDKDDAYMLRLDLEGNWVKLQPGESPGEDPSEDVPAGVTPPEVLGEEVGWDAIVKREGEETDEEAAPAEDLQSDEAPAEDDPAQPDSEASEEISPDVVEDATTDSAPPQP